MSCFCLFVTRRANKSVNTDCCVCLIPVAVTGKPFVEKIIWQWYVNKSSRIETQGDVNVIMRWLQNSSFIGFPVKYVYGNFNLCRISWHICKLHMYQKPHCIPVWGMFLMTKHVKLHQRYLDSFQLYCGKLLFSYRPSKLL